MATAAPLADSALTIAAVGTNRTLRALLSICAGQRAEVAQSCLQARVRRACRPRVRLAGRCDAGFGVEAARPLVSQHSAASVTVNPLPIGRCGEASGAGGVESRRADRAWRTGLRPLSLRAAKHQPPSIPRRGVVRSHDKTHVCVVASRARVAATCVSSVCGLCRVSECSERPVTGRGPFPRAHRGHVEGVVDPTRKARRPAPTSPPARPAPAAPVRQGAGPGRATSRPRRAR